MVRLRRTRRETAAQQAQGALSRVRSCRAIRETVSVARRGQTLGQTYEGFRGRRALITEHIFETDHVARVRYAIRGLAGVYIICHDPEGESAAQILGSSALVASVLVVPVIGPVSEVLTAVTIGAFIIGGAFHLRRRSPMRRELVATYKGRPVVLYVSEDETEFDQVCRGLQRALEHRGRSLTCGRAVGAPAKAPRPRYFGSNSPFWTPRMKFLHSAGPKERNCPRRSFESRMWMACSVIAISTQWPSAQKVLRRHGKAALMGSPTTSPRIR